MRVLLSTTAVLGLALVLLLSSCGGGGGGFTNDGSPASMLARINALRATTGLAPLATNAELQVIAQTHADYMADIKQLKPTDAAGTTLLVLVQGAGFGGNGSILSSGDSELEIFTRLQNNPANRAILTDSNYTLSGIGYRTSSNAQWWCFLFSTVETP